MNAEIFAVAISNLMFGFLAGLTVDALMNTPRLEKLNESVQKAIDMMFDKDQQIDELTEELEEIKFQYKELYESADKARRLLTNAINLSPPNSPLVRSEHYVEEEDESGSPVPETPTSTCVPSNKD
jgi:hypothetical protein